jgi:6-phosphofructokinase 1
VIRAIVRKAVGTGSQVVGFREGWRGAMSGEVVDLTVGSVHGILPRGGTILGSSGTNPYHDDGVASIRTTVRDLSLDGLIAIGGEGTLGAAARLCEDGIPVIGVPKTIDNDIPGTDACVGFHTAVQVATDAIDRLHTTAESHNRLMLIEVMGRSAGWIALTAGIAGGADVILVPERPFDLDDVARHIRNRHLRGHRFTIVVVAEGATPMPGSFELPPYGMDERGFPRYGGVAHALAPELAERTGFEARVTVLGHVQRGGSPNAQDRVLATRFGTAAVDLAGRGQWGRMVALRGVAITDVALKDVLQGSSAISDELYAVAEVFF